MKCVFITFFLFFLIIKALAQEDKSPMKVVSIAFYNLENLFDILDNPNTWDESFTPKGDYNWTSEKLEAKVENLALVISKIGERVLGHGPSFLGVAEVENRNVLELLINHPILKPYDYGIAHFNSPDARGIDVGFLYRRNQFQLKHMQKHYLVLKDDAGKPILTRDQLCVSGFLNKEKLYFIVNHWPSRRGGVKRSEKKRILAARLTQKVSDSIYQIDRNANIVIMGDFNDNPTDKAFKEVLKTESIVKETGVNYFFNPYEVMFKKGLGTLGFRDKWYLFDQILISHSLTDSIGWQYLKSSIFKPPFLQNRKGKYKGYPKRSAGSMSGFSDHFPIYMFLGIKP